MIKVGSKVFIRDPYIVDNYMVPQCEVIAIECVSNVDASDVDILSMSNLFTSRFLVRFTNGETAWFAGHCIKEM